MKTTLDLPGDLVKELKFLAIDEDQNLKDTVAETLRAGLAARRDSKSGRGKSGQSRPRASIRKDRKTGLPVVHCSPDAPARRMTAAQLRSLEQQAQTLDDLEKLRLPIRH